MTYLRLVVDAEQQMVMGFTLLKGVAKGLEA